MGGLLGKKPVAPKPTPLPDENELDKARRRTQQQALAGSGRKGTQLTQPAAQTGSEFQRTTLG